MKFMKFKANPKTTMLCLLLLFVALPLTLTARSMIYDILAKGSQWLLNADGETGTLELLGGKGNRTADGGWRMQMDVRWQNNPGTLRAHADGNNWQQHVTLSLKRKNGLPITCEGYVAMESARMMAGTTNIPAKPKNLHGAWYATLIKQGNQLGNQTDHDKDGRTSDAQLDKNLFIGPMIRACSISGRVHGKGMKAAKVFYVSLYGPDNPRLHRQTRSFDHKGNYRFGGLPQGRYRVTVGTKADTMIAPHPRERSVECRGKDIENINFELK